MYLKSELIQKPEEFQNLRTFLKVNKLPHQDVKSDGNLFVAYYNVSGNIIGSGGLELYGAYALLRSVAVSEGQRGENLGKTIVDDLLQRAKACKIQSIFLLTETAHDFFSKKGFSDISRDDVPSEVKSSSEFTFICPVSAACMRYKFDSK